MSTEGQAVPLANNPEDKFVLCDTFPPLRILPQAGAYLRLWGLGRA